uniref:Potential DNA-binding domain-containing protein n=1 Tax=Meloidogyne incognita TaxID=6306 RepID=A0A914LFW5_MELIC
MDTVEEKSEISRTIEILNATNSVTLDIPLPSNLDSDDHTPIDVQNSTNKLNAHFCEHIDQLKGQCKQRAINGFVYCIRHILLDPSAPYRQCQHKRKPKNKHDPPDALCTNAIRSASSEIYCSTHLIMKGLKDPKLSRKDSKLNNNSKASNSLDLEDMLNCRKSQHPHKSSQLFHNSVVENLQIKDGGPYRETIPWSNISLNRQHDLENIDKRRSDNFYPLADRLLKSPTRQLNIEPSTSYGSENDNITCSQDTSFCISKTYPQLSAKLLHREVHNSEKQNTRDECIISNGPNSNFMTHKNISTEAKLMKSPERKIVSSNEFVSHYSINNCQTLPEIRSHQNQNLTEYDFPASTFSSNLSSSLYFINSEKIPRHYDIDRLEQKLAAETEDENELVKFQRDYANDFDANFSTMKRKQKVIKLRQKRQKVRIDGVFRKVRAVDTMCRVVESYDFDWTDLFPLGLEPSDDESSSDDSFPSFDDDHHVSNSLNDNKHSRNRLELYLLKKKLRLESARLVQRAKLCIPINMAAKHYVNYTGAALRIRRVNKGRGNFEGKIRENRFKKCAQILQHQITRDGKRHLFNARCQNFCLPWAVYCADHIAYSVTQQLFAYCKWRFCNVAVPATDALLFEGFCRRHYLEKQKMAQNLNSGHSTQDVPTQFMRRELSGSVLIARNSCENPATGTFPDDAYPCTNTNRDLNVVDGDVSLASVAKDLGFDGRELTDMLERLPVEEAFEGEMEPDDENFLNDVNKDDSDEVPPGISLGHSWADVEQFLLEQEQQSISDESTPQF